MTPLEEHLIRRIEQSGPITIGEYMHEALLHPEFGYYTNREVFGAEGDFITAPEISQMFGELIGLALAQYWIDMGRPAKITLAELGPGRGTLMADILRATQNVPGFHKAAQIVFGEASPKLQAQQEQVVPQATWIGDISKLPEQPLLLVANEFFDALPIRQFQRVAEGWRERVIGLRKGKLAVGLASPSQPEFLHHRLDDTEENQIVEVSRTAQALAGAIGTHIAEFGGLAYVIDYGDGPSRGDTFQALRAHSYVDILDAPGTADLTAHVDFEALARAAHPAKTAPLTTQGAFLMQLGIAYRAQSLAQGQSERTRKSLEAAVKRLTAPDEMGTLFKVLAISAGEAAPPGV